MPRPASTREPTRFHHYEFCVREDGNPLELGRGSMGVTYKALDVNLQVPVALKVISPRYSAHPQARERFLREARAAARLRHPNVAAVHHYGTTESDAGLRDVAIEDDPAGSHCCYAMEFIEGEKRACTATGRCPCRPCWRSPCRWRRRSKLPKGAASCTATSSPPTSCSRPRGARRG